MYRLSFLTFALAIFPLLGIAEEPQKPQEKVLVTAGKFVKIYDPSVGEQEKWYINDHCFLHGEGKWHLFGITHAEPANPRIEIEFAHATAEKLLQQPWDKQPFALTVAKEAPWNELHLWAPHVIFHDGTYYMYYCAGDKNPVKYRIHLATSKDLKNWTRHPKNPMVADGVEARDPFILRHDDEWLMYYTASTSTDPKTGNHAVACVRSTDLVTWSDRTYPYIDPQKGTFAGPTESPFVVRRGNSYYLFVGPRPDYNGTDVFVSDDPLHWTVENKVGHFNSHCAEIIRDSDGKWYISRAGWGQGGVYLAPLTWSDGLDDAETNLPVPTVATEPTKVLCEWESLKYGMFIHFGLSTFVGDQFGRIPSPSTAYAPTELDEEQWARTAKDAGMKYMVLTVKHHYGHCLWPSKYTDYTVATSVNKLDVVERFVAACRKHDLKPGFYYSLGWDSQHMKKLAMKPEDYEQFVHNQLTELLTGYGPITILWFDIPWDMGPDMSGALARLYAHCKAIQPDCLILLNQGFVDGSYVEKRLPSYMGKDVSQTPTPIWPKDINNGERVSPPATGHNPRIAFEGKQYYIPNEVCDSLGQERWFWGPGDGVRPARQMYELYKQSVGRGSNLLLNAGPDKTGRIPAETVERLREIAKMIAQPDRVQDSLLVGRLAKASNVYHNDLDKWGPQRAIDMDITAEGGTRWATDDNVKSAWLEVDLDGEKTFDRATIADAFGYVRAFELQIPDEKGGWKTIHQGKAIGDLGAEISFPPVKADRIRLLITESTNGPTIWDFAIYPAK